MGAGKITDIDRTGKFEAAAPIACPHLSYYCIHVEETQKIAAWLIVSKI